MAAAEDDWRRALSSMDRYESIQQIKRAIEAADPSHAAAQKEALARETEAYKTAASLDEYRAACRALPAPAAAPDAPPPPPGEDAAAAVEARPESPGVRIGPYENCHYVDSGVTAAVYRAQARALKVITETRDIAPHNPFLEARILATLTAPSCIPLLDTFRDQEQRFVLVFPYMPLTLEALLARAGPAGLPRARVRALLGALLGALAALHAQGIVHRDVKPSAVLLAAPDGPAYLADFGTAWHPALSPAAAPGEPADAKVLDVGTGPYRAPEVLFGDRAYGPPVDLWAAGALLAECCRRPPRPLFESRAAHEDGNQLGLILSIFKTIGSPTRASWPEAARFRTPPFDMYRAFAGRPWPEILDGVEPDFQDLIASLVKYGSSRATAAQALQAACLRDTSS